MRGLSQRLAVLLRCSLFVAAVVIGLWVLGGEQCACMRPFRILR